jgi:hypothetical protein
MFAYFEAVYTAYRQRSIRVIPQSYYQTGDLGVGKMKNTTGWGGRQVGLRPYRPYRLWVRNACTRPKILPQPGGGSGWSANRGGGLPHASPGSSRGRCQGGFLAALGMTNGESSPFVDGSPAFPKFLPCMRGRKRLVYQPRRGGNRAGGRQFSKLHYLKSSYSFAFFAAKAAGRSGCW